MAKSNRNTAGAQAQQAFPGREDLSGQDTANEQGAEGVEERTDEDGKEGGEDGKVSVPLSDKNRIERGLMHLGFLVQELEGLINQKTETAGLMRRAAAINKQQIDSELKDWPPIRVIRQMLEKVGQQLK